MLTALSLAPMHGWGISQRIQELSADALKVWQGSLYQALYRLEKPGLIKSEWATTENNREAKYYALTRARARTLGQEVESWRHFTCTVDRILDATAEGLA